LAPLGSPENFDLRHRPVVHACGLPISIDKEDSTFEINAEQYLSANKQTDNVFPLRCLFPATPRWERYKPMPAKGKSVAIEGVITGVERNEDRTVKHFIVDMEKVTFLGQTPTAPKAETSPAKPGAHSILFFLILNSKQKQFQFILAVLQHTSSSLAFSGAREVINQQNDLRRNARQQMIVPSRNRRIREKGHPLGAV
jgi:hypothetical protein